MNQAKESTAYTPQERAMLDLVALLQAAESGESKIPGFAFVAYPELSALREKMRAARESVNVWMGSGS